MVDRYANFEKVFSFKVLICFDNLIHYTYAIQPGVFLYSLKTSENL